MMTTRLSAAAAPEQRTAARIAKHKKRRRAARRNLRRGQQRRTEGIMAGKSREGAGELQWPIAEALVSLRFELPSRVVPERPLFRRTGRDQYGKALLNSRAILTLQRFYWSTRFKTWLAR